MKYIPDLYEPRKHVTIPVRPDWIVRGPLGNEMSATLRLSGETVRIYIPAWAYDEETSTIHAEAVGELNGQVMFVFPATNLGTPQCSVPKPEVESWLKQEDRYLEGPVRNLW